MPKHSGISFLKIKANQELILDVNLAEFYFFAACETFIFNTSFSLEFG